MTCVQLLSGPRRDSSSDLNVPPRAVNGNGALPVLGHTLLFHKLGGDMAALFHPEGRAWKWFPWSRQLGETYSVFLWGQWRVMVIGPEKVRKVMGEAEVAEGWPYGTPPVALLGKSCPALLDGEEAECLRRMIYTPLSYASVVKHAPQFAEIAQKCIDDIVAGHFNKHHDTHDAERPRKRPQDLPFSESQSSDGGENSKAHKVKHEALRAYTFDLIDGPVLNMDRYSAGSTYSSRTSVRLKNISGGRVDEANRTVRFEDDNSVDDDDDDEPTPELIMLWIDRLKDGLCDIKFTFGPTWMQLWRLNPYGRALNARQHLEAIIQDHVEQREKLVPVHHEKGRMTRDPFTSPLPLVRKTNKKRIYTFYMMYCIIILLVQQRIAPHQLVFSCVIFRTCPFLQLKMTENYFFRNHHHVMGKNRSKSNIQQTSTRARTQSESDLPDQHLEDSSRLSSGALLSPVVLRDRAQSEPDLVAEMDSSRSLGPKPITRKKTPSILDQILREADFEGRGITKAATTEISILLWMMLDAGQGWTAMALHLLAKHDDAQMTVQAEIDRLERTYGTDRLFTSFVLGKMDKLNNLIYESMRLCPQFLGGLKIINQTVEVGNVQIPKNSNVIFCNPHDDETFTIDYIPAKRPEEMGIFYPSLEL